jgi:hypothetical protein
MDRSRFVDCNCAFWRHLHRSNAEVANLRHHFDVSYCSSFSSSVKSLRTSFELSSRECCGPRASWGPPARRVNSIRASSVVQAGLAREWRTHAVVIQKTTNQDPSAETKRHQDAMLSRLRGGQLHRRILSESVVDCVRELWILISSGQICRSPRGSRGRLLRAVAEGPDGEKTAPHFLRGTICLGSLWLGELFCECDLESLSRQTLGR